ncbi:signal peptidase I [Streptosporangium sp. LJ11]|uniref:signal peptidase I n=1 Tax=Streptosporangium sp. LJ11 TaxID=3436927 RepID=UPI003F7AFF04
MTAGSENKQKKPFRKGRVRESLFLLVCSVMVAMLLQVFVFRLFWIPSESMENTLREGDGVVVNKLHGAAERGDVVVFKGWDGEDTVKRVMAVGGDTVTCCDAKKRITVNGIPLDERNHLHPDDFPSKEEFEKVVPEGRLWVMGDRRSASRDSRDHKEQEGGGTIAQDDVTGRAVAIWWPLSRVTVLSTPDTFAQAFTGDK